MKGKTQIAWLDDTHLHGFPVRELRNLIQVQRSKRQEHQDLPAIRRWTITQDPFRNQGQARLLEQLTRHPLSKGLSRIQKTTRKRPLTATGFDVPADPQKTHMLTIPFHGDHPHHHGTGADIVGDPATRTGVGPMDIGIFSGATRTEHGWLRWVFSQCKPENPDAH